MSRGTEFDVAVIGAGPGGYVAAIRAAQLGMNPVLVEKAKTFGGTCLNVGCIPSKALLDSSELYMRIRQDSAKHGISFSKLELNLAEMLERKSQIVDKLTRGVGHLLKENGVTTYRGTAGLVSSNQIRIDSETGKEDTITARNIILATGSVPAELPFLPFDGKRIVSSTEALSFESVPEELIVVGGGAIGLELGSVWSRLGASVKIVELLPQILPGWDLQVSRALHRALKHQGLDIHVSTKVTGFEVGGKIQLKAENINGEALDFEGDQVLVAVGRRSNIEALNLSNLGVDIDQKSGRIVVNQSLQTEVNNIYAIGDLVSGPQLAHKAQEEGVAVVEHLAGIDSLVNYEAIPSIVYTWPEVASVGKTEEQLEAAKIEYVSGTFLFKANGRALAAEDGEGFVKILAEKHTDRIMGVHIIGPWASDLIHEAVLGMEFGASAEDIARTMHAHPTLSEVVKEAALAVDNRAIHAPPARK